MIKWKGKLTPTQGKDSVPEGHTLFIDAKSTLSMAAAVVFVLLVAFAAFHLKMAVTGVKFDRMGFLLGLLLAIPFIAVHEYLHALCFTSGSSSREVHLFWTTGGFGALPIGAFSRRRYIVALCVPAVVLGFLPLLGWLFVPADYRMFSSVLYLFAVGSLAACVADFSNLYRTIRYAPKGAQIEVINMLVYWFR
ncbi:MAG: DUF3267 domain-containing protein [Oscillospiraceae bacterium]|jgi:hypothetical protein|nr:DUF3267 domain-containing protein [Oscillospiraceae bacterium]